MLSKKVCSYSSKTLHIQLLINVDELNGVFYQILLNNKHWRSFRSYDEAVRLFANKVLTHSLVINPLIDPLYASFIS